MIWKTKTFEVEADRVAAGRVVEARDAAVGKVQAARAVTDRVAAINPAPDRQATASAPAAGIKSRTWRHSAALTAPALNVGRG